MVGRDVGRRKSISSHPKVDSKKKGADRYADAHVGSTHDHHDDRKATKSGKPVAGPSTRDAGFELPKSTPGKSGAPSRSGKES